ncbi:Proteinase inhibitor I13, potato inhibitor I [Corchorus olitorius]|uniref:Proteinase inhibitor I13, potato inhibitor I n=1 Tax=Corchorus olitorius TaxID=93759 RepID=A0A1R3K1Z6_9ROSI|nr:Proteinase inhibitor I13, potato inhibitor I [Corchorus olitorius]
MASDEYCQEILAGKSSWPELVGVKGEIAEATIEKENPLVDARIVVVGRAVVTAEFRCDRVWVWVDDNGNVARTPIIG